MFAYVNVMISRWFTSNPESLEKYDERAKAVAPVLKESNKYFLFTTGGKSDMASNNTPATRAIFTKYGIQSDTVKWREATPCMFGDTILEVLHKKYLNRKS